jgi:Domain of unknown function (DUF222)
MFDIEEAAEALEEAASSVDVDALDGTRALRPVQTLARVERVVAGARTVVTRRVEETRAWKRTGHRTIADWLAATNGTSLGEAIGSIQTARSLPDLPATEAAFRSGEISETQARVVSSAATEDVHAEQSLLDTAKTETVKTLRQRSRAVVAAATAEDDERARDARIHRERYLRRWLDTDGALCWSARGPVDAGARLVATLDAHVERLAKRAADDGVTERDEALAFDALITLADPGQSTPAAVQLTVDAARLRHEPDASGETCHIAGIGEVSVPAAERLLGNHVLSTIVRDGIDVKAITRPGRARSASIEQAVRARSPLCERINCDDTDHLELHHIVPSPTAATPPSTNSPTSASGTIT